MTLPSRHFENEFIGVYFVASNDTSKIHICGQANHFILVKYNSKLVENYEENSFTFFYSKIKIQQKYKKIRILYPDFNKYIL